MNWLDHFRDGVSAFIAAVVAAIVAAVGWLIRTVFTSRYLIDKQETELRNMREDIVEVKDSVKRIEDVLLRDVTNKL